METWAGEGEARDEGDSIFADIPTDFGYLKTALDCLIQRIQSTAINSLFSTTDIKKEESTPKVQSKPQIEIKILDSPPSEQSPKSSRSTQTNIVQQQGNYSESAPKISIKNQVKTQSKIQPETCHLCRSLRYPPEDTEDTESKRTHEQLSTESFEIPLHPPSPPHSLTCCCCRYCCDGPFPSSKPTTRRTTPRISQQQDGGLSSNNFAVQSQSPRSNAVEEVEYTECCSTNCVLWKHYIPVLRNLQEKGEFTTDVIIVLGKEEFAAHKVVLSAFSTYFEDIFLKDENQRVNISSVGVTEVGFRLALDWMYTGHVEMNETTLGHLWTSGKRLGIKRLCKLCKQQLRRMIRQQGKAAVEKIIGDQNAVADCVVVVLDEKNSSPTGRQRPRAKIRASANVAQLIKSGDFVQWTVDQITRFLSNNDIKISSEREVFDMAAAWLRFRWPERESHVTRIMSCVRFPLMSRQEITRSFTHDCNKFLWTNREFVTMVLISYLSHSGNGGNTSEPTKKKPTDFIQPRRSLSRKK